MYHPDDGMYYPPEENGFHPDTVDFHSLDGTHLSGWFFKAKNPKGTIVQFHGNAQNMTSHYGSLAWIVNSGYNLFTFDYRGYGISDGEPTPKGVYEDGIAALNRAYLEHKQSGAKKFVVYGQSLGVPVALRSSTSSWANINLMVADSGFLSYKSIFSQTMRKAWILFPFSFIPYITVSDDYSPKDTISDFSTPLLVIHDKSDPIVDFSNGKEIFDKSLGPKDMWELNKGHHIATFFIEKSKYKQIFLDYLENLK